MCVQGMEKLSLGHPIQDHNLSVFLSRSATFFFLWYPLTKTFPDAVQFQPMVYNLQFHRTVAKFQKRSNTLLYSKFRGKQRSSFSRSFTKFDPEKIKTASHRKLVSRFDFFRSPLGKLASNSYKVLKKNLNTCILPHEYTCGSCGYS